MNKQKTKSHLDLADGKFPYLVVRRYPTVYEILPLKWSQAEDSTNSDIICPKFSADEIQVLTSFAIQIQERSNLPVCLVLSEKSCFFIEAGKVVNESNEIPEGGLAIDIEGNYHNLSLEL